MDKLDLRQKNKQVDKMNHDNEMLYKENREMKKELTILKQRYAECHEVCDRDIQKLVVK